MTKYDTNLKCLKTLDYPYFLSAKSFFLCDDDVIDVHQVRGVDPHELKNGTPSSKIVKKVRENLVIKVNKELIDPFFRDFRGPF